MTRNVRRTSLLASLLVFGFVIAVAALRAEPLPPMQQGGVTVDFLATSASGQPITDLKPSDVSVKIGGKQRAVASLEFKTLEAGRGGPVSALPAPFAMNTASSGRSLLIVIDNESLRVGTERAVRESLDEILSKLGPADRVAFSVAPRDTVGLGFGAGVAAVRAAVAKFAGIRAASVTSADSACRSRDSLVMLRSMMQAQAGSEAPTSVLFIASGLSLPGTVNRNTTSDLSCEVLTEQFQSISTAAAQGRINLYVAQGDDTISSRNEGLENLAGVGGAGGVLRAVPGGLTRVASESAGYWIATVAGDSGDRPGTVTKLDLKVNREGVTTRARSDYAVSKAGARAGAKPLTPREMVATTAPFTDLQLRSDAVVSRGADGKMSVFTLTEPVEPGVKLAAAAALIIAPGATNATFARTATDKELAARMLVLGLAASPGKYRVRVAAADTNGRAGAVDLDVDVNLVAAGPLQIGQMMLLAPRGDSFSPQMIFTDEAEAAIVFDLYGPLTTSKVGLKVDIAATIDGPTLAEGALGYAPTNEPDKFNINAKIPIAKLAPGDYVVRAIVQVEGQPEGRVTKTLRKLPK